METGDKFLYYYTKVDRFLFENLINGAMMFNSASSFNDPFDCKAPVIYGVESDERIIGEYYDYFDTRKLPKFTFGLTKDAFIDAWIRNPGSFELRLHNELIKSNRNDFGILCLSKSPNKIKMWSHYSNSHKGICLQLDYTNWITIEANNIINVNYPPNNHYQNFLDKNIPLTDSLIGHLITKSNEWKEEEESRVLMQTPGLHNIRKECLRKIIFGIDTTEEEIKTLKALVKKLDYPNLFFAKCRPSTQTFAVFIEDDPT